MVYFFTMCGGAGAGPTNLSVSVLTFDNFFANAAGSSWTRDSPTPGVEAPEVAAESALSILLHFDVLLPPMK